MHYMYLFNKRNVSPRNTTVEIRLTKENLQIYEHKKTKIECNNLNEI